MSNAKEIIMQASRKMKANGERKIKEGEKMLKQAEELKKEANKL